MKVAVSGSSGFVGRTLLPHLRASGHQVVRLVRRDAQAPDEVAFDPTAGVVDLAALAGVDAVVNLAGAGIGDKRWTAAYKRELYSSHVDSAATVARAVAALDPRPAVLVSVGAMGYYGNSTGGVPLTEQSPPGRDFAAQIVVDKEAATAPASDAGVRVVLPRLSLVMGGDGGVLGRRLLPLAKAGLLGPLAGGSSVWSVVSVPDVARSIAWMLTTPQASGPYNVSAPQVTTNGEFTRLLGQAVRRPTLLPVPKFGLSVVLGEFAQDVLADFDVRPDRIVGEGFTFEHPDAASIIAASLR
jgi:uncharacterized protein (TIGR01777 family)